MNNLDTYNAVRVVPQEAKKTITGGRLKGMTDINPMWRIKMLTEQFGPCGIGWKYVIKDKRLETGSNNEIAAFMDIDLFVKYEGMWSEAIPGTGGSMFVTKEKNGPYTSDECFKMALTDALSVACKALGFGADVYWEKDSTKYSSAAEHQKQEQQTIPPQQLVCADCGEPFKDVTLDDGKVCTAEYQYMNAIQKRGGAYCKACHEKRKAAAK